MQKAKGKSRMAAVYLDRVLNNRLFPGILLLAMTIVCSASECKKDSGSCDHRATLADMSALDGCSLMLVLEDGRKLLPTNLGENLAAISPGEQVRISYKILDGMASICMAEDHIVELTCFEGPAGTATEPCPEMIDPYKPAWSMEVMKALDPQRVERMLIDGQVTYHYQGKERGALYSCDGQELCTYSAGDLAKCSALLNKATDAQIIYVMDQRP